MVWRLIAYMEGFNQIMTVKTYSLLIIESLSILSSVNPSLYKQLTSGIFIEGAGTLFAFLSWDIYLFPSSNSMQLYLFASITHVYVT